MALVIDIASNVITMYDFFTYLAKTRASEKSGTVIQPKQERQIYSLDLDFQQIVLRVNHFELFHYCCTFNT